MTAQDSLCKAARGRATAFAISRRLKRTISRRFPVVPPSLVRCNAIGPQTLDVESALADLILPKQRRCTGLIETTGIYFVVNPSGGNTEHRLHRRNPTYDSRRGFCMCM